MYTYCSSSLSSKLISVTHVLLELICVREGAIQLCEFDNVVVRQFIGSICTTD